MKLPKRDKSDKPTKAKIPRMPGEKAPADPFWVTWQKKRAAAKMPRRESSIPKKPMSKEDRMKLIAAGTIFVLVPIVWMVLNYINSHRVVPPPK